MKKESKLVNEIRNEIKRLGGKSIKIHGSQYIEIGSPDILGCLKGKTLAIECKLISEEPSKIQQYRLEEWRKSGAITGVAHSLEEAKTIINRGLHG